MDRKCLRKGLLRLLIIFMRVIFRAKISLEAHTSEFQRLVYNTQDFEVITVILSNISRDEWIEKLLRGFAKP